MLCYAQNAMLGRQNHHLNAVQERSLNSVQVKHYLEPNPKHRKSSSSTSTIEIDVMHRRDALKTQGDSCGHSLQQALPLPSSGQATSVPLPALQPCCIN